MINRLDRYLPFMKYDEDLEAPEDDLLKIVKRNVKVTQHEYTKKKNSV